MFYTVSVAFPHLGISIENLGRSISIFGFEIAYYGIIIALGITAGYCLAQFQAKRTGQDPDIYLDFAMYVIIAAIIGARLYYVIFSWDDYKDSPMQILNIRAGGLAIYGAVLTSIAMVFIYGKLKKYPSLLIADTGVAGLVIGQAIGRWGNFFNREAFGRYTDSLFAMQIKRTDTYSSVLNNDPEYLKNVVLIDGVEYIQVHPTFLYESVACLIICIIILALTKKKHFDGELLCIYMFLYGTFRFFNEGLRTDQLLIWNTGIAVSQVVSLGLAGIGLIVIIVKEVRYRKENNKSDDRSDTKGKVNTDKKDEKHRKEKAKAKAKV